MASGKIHMAATLGDPTGIGPEIGEKAIGSFLNIHKDVQIHLFASKRTTGKFKSAHIRKHLKSERLHVHDLSSISSFSLASKNSGARAYEDLKMATAFCLSRRASTLTTGPLDKKLVSKTDSTFTGHTEFLKKKSKVPQTTMLLGSSKMKVSLVTTHLPLKQVSKSLSKEKIISTAIHTHKHLKDFKKKPRLAVCSLNPHASDSGLFGDEEKKVISPAVTYLKRKGLQVSGPYPADSLFYRASDFDAIICMYHDQGLIPLKMSHFFDAINITLGLPFLRTSVDHGTAFDIVGKGKASHLSYENALEYAYLWAKKGASHRNQGRERT